MDPDQPSTSSSQALRSSQTSNTGGGGGGARKKTGQKFELSDVQIADLKRAFDILDTECTGFIEVDDLKVAIRGLGFEPEAEEMQRMRRRVDPRRTGRLSFNDFVAAMSSMSRPRGGNAEETRKARFRFFDDDDDENEEISFEDLYRVARLMGKTMTKEELDEMFDGIEFNEDGEISEENYLRFVRNTRNIE